jgi:glycosyltransferase involved in cell wall biosynthesis
MLPSHARPSSPPVAVARIITRLNIGGPARQAIGLTTALDAEGFTTTLIHGRLGVGEGDMSTVLPANANAVFTPRLQRPISPVDDLRTLLLLYRTFKQVRPRIVHTHMAKAGLLGRLAAAAFNLTRGSAPRARVVHTYHGHVLEGYFSPLMTRVFITLERLLATCSDRLIAISPAIRGELIDRYRIGASPQYRVIPLGFDLSELAAVDDARRAAARAHLGLASDVPVVSTVGRLTAIKQPRLFLETIADLTRTRPTLIALVAGDGELRAESEAYAAALGIADRTKWLGWRRDLATIYGATDVFLLTSRNEGTPVALIEAMAAAVPGVSTDVGGVKDVIDSPEVGVLAPPGDAAALARGVERLLAAPALRRHMGERARANVLTRYSSDRLVADIVTLYRELLQER